MYGFISLEKDLQTVGGITFYEHGETPGLGGEVDNPRWKASWQGKRAMDATGDVILQVIKGAVNPESDSAKHQIDGLSGATLTTRGLDNLIQYWLGDNGYGPFLAQQREAL
jgi:Na+-transporting NADH:ubiquinone oxidoreductase subunit C